MGKVTEGDIYGTNFSIESMKIIAESIGIGNLQDDAAKELADDISFRLKHLIQDSAKFMNHAKRIKLLPSDIDSALKVRNIEPQYGFHTTEPLPFRFASGGGRELHFVEEKEIDLTEVLTNFNTKLPLEVSLRSHWLAIDGTQPTIPENPPPVSKQIQKAESVDPINKKPLKAAAGKPSTGKQKLKNVETVQIKQLATHELSVEQQLYYKEITEACVGSEELPRGEALQSLVSDPGLHEMLPRMCTFIIEGIRVNVVQSNLALLIYLMRMVKALVDNQSLYLEKYLHELIPSVITCIVSKQLCARPEADNHWALRDFASRLMGQICKNFNTSTNNIQTRVTRIFSNALNRCDKIPLSSLYGALHGLSELGTEVTRIFILPKIRNIGARIGTYCDLIKLHKTDKASNDKMAADLIASDHIMLLLLRVLTPVVKSLRTPPDNLEDYKQEYGYIGKALHEAVLKARTQPAAATTLSGTSSSASCSSTTPGVGQNITRTMSSSGGIIQQGNLQSRTLLMGTQQSQRITLQQSTQPKMILMQPNSQTNQISSNTVVKLVPSGGQTSSQTKLVVVSNQGNFPHTQITTNKSNFVSNQSQSLDDMSQN